MAETSHRTAAHPPSAHPPGAPRVSLLACTIVARNYLPAARVLTTSYLQHHPQARLAVLVVDAVEAELDELASRGRGELYVTPGALDLDRAEFTRMAAAYTVTELSTALKPWLLRWALRHADAALYLDPDIELYAPLPELAERTLQYGIVLTPHVLRPMPRDGLRPTEADIMASGVFNLGFIAVSAAAGPFLEFWQERLRTDAISAPAEQLFTDQRWVDNVPALYAHVVVEDPGWNVAYWNVYQRPLQIGADAAVTAGGHRLRFFHFSGYRPEKPWLLSTHFADRPRVLLSEHPVLAQLCAGYRERLIAEGYAETVDSVPYRFGALADGTPLTTALRRVYRSAWVQSERDGTPPPPSPFADPDGFLSWVTAAADDAQRRVGSNRWAMAVWSSRPDLQQVFPHPLGVHARAFRDWCAESGVPERCLPAAAVPQDPARDSTPIDPTPGANVLGYLTAELGVGELGRLVHEAVAAGGLPVTAVVETAGVVNRTEHPLAAGVAQGPPRHPITLLCVNADMTPGTLDAYPEVADGRYVIGIWSWELDDFPPGMRAAFSRVDEIWTISEFCRRAIAPHSPVPVHTFPVPVRPAVPPAVRDLETSHSYEGSDGGDRAAYRAGAGAGARFLFVFDFNSVFERKNPVGVVRAFQRAFPGPGAVQLIIKSINGERHPGDRERLRAAAAGDPRIELVEHYLSADEVTKLFSTADCYVSLHRSEGFGLTIAEAMAHGLPVICTDYSGSSEVLAPAAGWPVPASMVEVGPGHPPYPAEARWADPDLHTAAAAMRAVVADPREAARRGAAGRDHLAKTRSPDAAARWVTERLTDAFGRWQRGKGALSGRGGGPQEPLAAARQALHWQADAGAPSRLPLAPVLRRAVLRALDHYDQHQRTVLNTLMDGVAQALARSHEELATRLDQLEAKIDPHQPGTAQRLAELTAGLHAAQRRHDELDEKTIALLRDRDERLGTLDELTGALHRKLDTARLAVLRHHDLLDKEPAAGDGASEPVFTDVGVLRLPAADTVVLPWLREYGTWEEPEAALVDELLTPGGTFVDIGAHIGYYTVRALRRVGPRGAVIAVEPWADVRELLIRNVAGNVGPAAASALTVIDAAAWDVPEPLIMSTGYDGNSGDNRVHGPADGATGGTVEVHGVRLDDLEALAGRTVDVVKVDAQGRDHRALTGMAGILRRDHPTVICEFWPDGIREAGADPADILARYRDWGYVLEPVPADSGRRRQWADDDLIRLAQSSAGEFVTLRLRPLGAQR